MLPTCQVATTLFLTAPIALTPPPPPLPQVEAAEHAQNWTNGMLDFHRVLSNLTEVVSEHAKRRSSDSSSDSGSSDSGSSSDEEEDSDASGGKPPRQQKAKEAAAAGGSKKRKQASSSDSDSGSSSDEEEEEEEAAAAPRRVRAATHLGRFKKREAGKMTKGYSEHDLAAILGADPFAAAAAVTEVRREVSSSGYDSDSEPSGDEGAEQQQPAKAKAASAAAAAQQPPAPPAMIVVRRPMLAYRPVAAPPTPQESRQPGWWQVCFHRAAGQGSGVGAQRTEAAKPAAINIHGFSEQDQTNLYMLAHVSACSSIAVHGVLHPGCRA